MSTPNPRRYTLSLSCPDRVGIVAAVSSFLAQHKGWITEASHHADPEAMRFFMRQEILADSLPFGIAAFRDKFFPIAREFDMDWSISDSARKKRVVILVSKQEHCLYDLFARWQIPVIVCARTALGTINHSLLTVEALRARGVPIHGIAFIGDAVPDSEAIIPAISGCKYLGRLPRLDRLDRETLSAAFAVQFNLADFH